MKFLMCCGRICVVLDMVMLRPMFGVETHEVSEVLWAYLFSVKYCCAKALAIIGISPTPIPSGNT